MIKVFLDANVYFAGCASSTGASALILRFTLQGRISVTTSRLVLREAERNLHRKRPAKDLEAFHRSLKRAKLRVVRTPPETARATYEGVIHPKDVPVLAAAVASNADYLVTLDRRHFLTTPVRTHVPELTILTPGDFLRRLIQLEPASG